MKKIILALALLIPFSAFSTEWAGTVVGISDGDTLTVLNVNKRQIKIRLVEIDAPESKQPFGAQSRQSLSDLCFKKAVIVDDNGVDKYKRTLGRIKCDGIDANAEQVRRGMAWAYRQYLTDPSIASLEDTAKAGKTGLWADKNPQAPWKYRQAVIRLKHSIEAIKTKTIEIEKSSADKVSKGPECGTKSRCGEMNSCTEANFYLQKCGVTGLDRNHDGVPCESICK